MGLTKQLFRFLQEFGILVFSMALDLQGHNQRWYILLSLDFLHYFYHLFLISTTLCFTFVLFYSMPFGKSVVMLIPSLIKIIQEAKCMVLEDEKGRYFFFLFYCLLYKYQHRDEQVIGKCAWYSCSKMKIV